MPTNDDTPTIDEILDGISIGVHGGLILTDYSSIELRGIDEAKAAIQNLIDRARLDEAIWADRATEKATKHDNDIQHDRIKALETKIKEGK